MKKLVWSAVFVMVLGGALCAQTWTTRRDSDGEETEYTIITREEFLRLIRQYQASRSYCIASLYDRDNLVNISERVIRGQAPRVNGEYYILQKENWDTLSASSRYMYNTLDKTNTLSYGNTQTGKRMWLTYYNNVVGDILGIYIPVNSTQYQQTISRCFGIIEGW